MLTKLKTDFFEPMEHFSNMMILLIMMHSGRFNLLTFIFVHINVAIIVIIVSTFYCVITFTFKILT